MNTPAATSSPFAGFLAEFRELAGLDPAAPIPPPRTAEEERALVAEQIRRERLERFRHLCPEEFRQRIELALIANPAAWAAADRWAGAAPGLWLWSHATGRGKTRMLWRKFGQLHVERGLAVVRLTGAHLAEEYHDACQRARTSQFYAQFRAIGAVFLDDLDKLALPDPRAERDSHAALVNGRMVRELFDEFYAHRIPVLVTANEPIAYFAARLGPSAERRMREVCHEIEF